MSCRVTGPATHRAIGGFSNCPTNFTKKVVIEGLFPGSPPRPQAGAATPEELEDDDFAFDNEVSPPTRGNMNPRDMFGLA